MLRFQTQFRRRKPQQRMEPEHGGHHLRERLPQPVAPLDVRAFMPDHHVALLRGPILYVSRQ
jgi:hypothetical protein